MTAETVPTDTENSDDNRTNIGSATRIDIPLPNAARPSAMKALRGTWRPVPGVGTSAPVKVIARFEMNAQRLARDQRIQLNARGA